MNPQPQQVILKDHKDILVYQFRLLNDYNPAERQPALNYLSYMWQLLTEQQIPLDPFGGMYRYVMYSSITKERYNFLITMDATNGTLQNISFEGQVHLDVAPQETA